MIEELTREEVQLIKDYRCATEEHKTMARDMLRCARLVSERDRTTDTCKVIMFSR